AIDDRTDPSRGGFDAWVVKVDANGNKQWDKAYGGSRDDEFKEIVKTNDGGYLFLGDSQSDAGGDKSQNSKGGFDLWVVKTDANGNKQWDSCYGGNLDEGDFGSFRKGFTKTADGGYIFVCNSASGISGNKTQANVGGKDIWIIKIGSNGIKQW